LDPESSGNHEVLSRGIALGFLKDCSGSFVEGRLTGDLLEVDEKWITIKDPELSACECSRKT
jgi:hypothetical protein